MFHMTVDLDTSTPTCSLTCDIMYMPVIICILMLTVVFMSRMAHRLTSHHRALFSPKYLSGTSAHITTTSYFRTPFDVKDSGEFQSRVLSSTKPVLVDFHAEYELLYFLLKSFTSVFC